MGLGPRVVEKIGRRELCAADFRFDPENRVHTHTRSFKGLHTHLRQVIAPGTAAPS